MNSENQYDADDEREWDDCPEDMELIESAKEQEGSCTASEIETGDEQKVDKDEDHCEIIAVIRGSRGAGKVNLQAPEGIPEKPPPKAKPRRRAAPAGGRVHRGKVSALRGDKYGVTPLHIAVERRSVELVKLLVKAGANVDAQDCSGRSPLHIACEMERMDLVQALLGMRANTLSGRRRIRQLHPPKGQIPRQKRRKLSETNTVTSESSMSTVT